MSLYHNIWSALDYGPFPQVRCAIEFLPSFNIIFFQSTLCLDHSIPLHLTTLFLIIWLPPLPF